MIVPGEARERKQKITKPIDAGCDVTPDAGG
jgi:hypothetical protein